MKKILYFFIVILILGLGATSVYFFLQDRKAEVLIFEQEKLLSNLEAQLEKKGEKETDITKQNKKILADLVASLDLNDELRAKNKELQNVVNELKKRTEKLEAELTKIEKRESQKEKEVKKEKGEKSREELISEIVSLEEKIDKLKEEKEQLEKRAKKERALSHYNLGVMYTKNEKYDKAISEFKKAVENDPSNADAYYNLGYLHKKENDPLNAAVYYRKYLELKPDATDARKVENLISELVFQEEDF